MEILIVSYIASVLLNTVAVILTDPKYDSKLKSILSKIFKVAMYSAFPVVNIFIPSFLLMCAVVNNEYVKEEEIPKKEDKHPKTETQMQNKLHLKKVELLKLKENLLDSEVIEEDKPKQKTLSK